MGNQNSLPECFGGEHAEATNSPKDLLVTPASNGGSDNVAKEEDDNKNLWSFKKLIEYARAFAAVSKTKNGASLCPFLDYSSIPPSQPSTALDWRAFLVLIHPQYGLLMLHCTRKKNKPPHYQLPGGHVDEEEFQLYQHILDKKDANGGKAHFNGWAQLYYAARAGAARELWEETGIDMRSEANLDRLLPLKFSTTTGSDGDDSTTKSSKKQVPLPNCFKERLFFVVQLENEDFPAKVNGDVSAGWTKPDILSSNDGKEPSDEEREDQRSLMVKLSVEHSGFIMEKDPTQAVDRLTWHSGGKVSKVLGLALRQSMHIQQGSDPQMHQQQVMDEEEAENDIVHEFGVNQQRLDSQDEEEAMQCILDEFNE